MCYSYSVVDILKSRVLYPLDRKIIGLGNRLGLYVKKSLSGVQKEEISKFYILHNRRWDMSKHIHGGNIYKYKNCTDFSANCNPLGTPESVIQAGIDSLRKVSDYPQVGYQPLRQAIADYEEVDSEQVICGNGAAELIFTLCKALNPKKALLMAPTFAEYQQALESVGCEIRYHMLTEDAGFRLKDDYLDALCSDFDVVFLCNPNNPTGILTEKSFLLKVLEKCRNNNIFLVVDECFQDFIEQPEEYTVKKEICTFKNLFLLKAFTKRYAMAGIRLGYGLCGNHALLEKMELCVQPWNISTIAQECGIAALKETEYVEHGRRLIFEEKEYLKQEMTKLGLKPYDSQANYLFFHGPEDLFERCVKKQILIRDCSNYIGLEPGYYRIAVKLHEDNIKFIQAVKEVMADRI